MSPNPVWLVSLKRRKCVDQHRHREEAMRMKADHWCFCNSTNIRDCQPAARAQSRGRVSSILRKHQTWQHLDFWCPISGTMRPLLWFSATLLVLCNKSLGIGIHVDSPPRKTPLPSFSSRDFNICYNSEPSSKHFTSVIPYIFHKNTWKRSLT